MKKLIKIFIRLLLDIYRFLTNDLIWFYMVFVEDDDGIILTYGIYLTYEQALKEQEFQLNSDINDGFDVVIRRFTM